jgi:hypothetical protein
MDEPTLDPLPLQKIEEPYLFVSKTGGVCLFP